MDDDHQEYVVDYESGSGKFNATDSKTLGDTPNKLKIIHGDPVSFKKSTFQGHVGTVTSTDQVK